MVVLYGTRGLGKRTSAIHLMRATTDAPLVTLLPDQSLKDLGGHTYTKGFAYLVLGWSGEDGNSESGDFGLDALVEKTQGVDAFVIITSEKPISGVQSSVIQQVAWSRPSDRAVLEAHGIRGDTLARAVAAITTEHGLGDVVELARRLREGVDLETAVTGLDLAERRRVEEWFAKGPTPREILEVTVLCFLAGVSERRFEEWLGLLLMTVDTGVDAETDGPISRDPAFLPVRQRPADSLITMERLFADTEDAIPGQTRRCLLFKSEGFHAHVVSALYSRYPQTFWEPVFAWLHRIIASADPVTRTRIAYGLALLASEDFDTIRERFLQPWSAETDWRPWRTASFVLWFMCGDHDLAPLARQTAIRWARSANGLRRKASAVAFSGGLGVLYPSEAVRFLWYLAEHDMSDSARSAIAQLYATLSDAGTGDHRVVLNDLLSRLSRHSGVGSPRLVLTIDVALDVLAFRNGDELLIASQIMSGSTEPAMLARLWAHCLCNRPRRTASFATLYDVLSALGAMGSKTQERTRCLLHRLAETLPRTEREPFMRDFSRYLTQRRNGTIPVSLFLPLLESIFSNSQETE
ncbi:hypothetical protein ACWEN6_06410 [Sphaerisporangium sp. NPDC004334]